MTVECILFMGITLSSLTAASGVFGGWFCVHGGKYGVKPALVNKCSELPLVKPVFSCCLSILSSSDSSESNLMWLVSWLDSIREWGRWKVFASSTKITWTLREPQLITTFTGCLQVLQSTWTRKISAMFQFLYSSSLSLPRSL